MIICIMCLYFYVFEDNESNRPNIHHDNLIQMLIRVLYQIMIQFIIGRDLSQSERSHTLGLGLVLAINRSTSYTHRSQV